MKSDRWNDYLSEYDQGLIDLVNAVDDKLRGWYPGLAEPDLMPMDDDVITGMHMAFDDGKNYLSLEIFNDGMIDIFYRDRTTDRLEGWESSLNDVSQDDIGEFVELYVVNDD